RIPLGLPMLLIRDPSISFKPPFWHQDRLAYTIRAVAGQVTGILSPWLRRRRFSHAQRWIRGKTLDYGCDDGALAAIISPENYVCYDVNGAVIEKARRQFPKHLFVTELPAEMRFETIAMLAVIEHLSNPRQILGQLERVLEDKGRIVITTPNPAFSMVHTIGGYIGLFSREASEEHESLLSYADMKLLVKASKLRIIYRERFLFGANQLFVLSKAQD